MRIYLCFIQTKGIQYFHYSVNATDFKDLLVARNPPMPTADSGAKISCVLAKVLLDCRLGRTN